MDWPQVPGPLALQAAKQVPPVLLRNVESNFVTFYTFGNQINQIVMDYSLINLNILFFGFYSINLIISLFVRRMMGRNYLPTMSINKYKVVRDKSKVCRDIAWHIYAQ